MCQKSNGGNGGVASTIVPCIASEISAKLFPAFRFSLQVKSEEASQKPHDFNGREHKPEGFEKEFLKWWENAPQLVQRIDDFWNSWVGHRTPR